VSLKPPCSRSVFHTSPEHDEVIPTEELFLLTLLKTDHKTCPASATSDGIHAEPSSVLSAALTEDRMIFSKIIMNIDFSFGCFRTDE
jgi:hypothetical protein